jgi:cytochrome P450
MFLGLLKRLFGPKLFGPKMLTDPYPFYARLRSAAPVYWVDQVGGWVLTRYADVISVLRSPHGVVGSGQQSPATVQARIPGTQRGPRLLDAQRRPAAAQAFAPAGQQGDDEPPRPFGGFYILDEEFVSFLPLY